MCLYLLYIHVFWRANNIALIIADTPGLCAQVFTDFGEKFIVFDVNGEEPISTMVAGVTQEADGGVVATLDEVRHGFEDGDSVKFEEVEGMTELNGTTHKIKVISVETFFVCFHVLLTYLGTFT